MYIDKLNPWNWFKLEDDSSAQVPVKKKETTGDVKSKKESQIVSKSSSANSLLQLHQEMDRLFDNVWQNFGLPGLSNFMSPTSPWSSRLFDDAMLGDFRARLDLSGDEKGYLVSIDLPGMSEDDIQIDLTGNTLTVKGEKEEKQESKDKQYYRVERSVGSFQRTLSLPMDADHESISASMKNGLLEINIPRKALPKEDVKRISITH